MQTSIINQYTKKVHKTDEIDIKETLKSNFIKEQNNDKLICMYLKLHWYDYNYNIFKLKL